MGDGSGSGLFLLAGGHLVLYQGNGALDGMSHLFGGEGFLEEVHRMQAQGAHRPIKRGMAGDDDGRHGPVVAAHRQLLEQLDAVDAGHLEIGDDDLKRLMLLHQIQRCHRRLGRARGDAQHAEPLAEFAQDIGIVVDKQNPRFAHFTATHELSNLSY